MNVASLELCKTLYELSGWENDYVYVGNEVMSKRDQVVEYVIDFDYPAYDLGYLMRQLPLSTHLTHMDKWYCNISSPRITKTDADTPEDAACKLATELFKQGILKKEQ